MIDLEKEDIAKVADSLCSWQKLKNKNVLISGGTGFLGQFIINVIKYRNAQFGDNINVISLSRHANQNNNEHSVKYLKCDVSNEIELDVHVDFILHLASKTHPKQYSADPIGTVVTNIVGSNNLLKLAKKNNARFLLASSVEIYGDGCGEEMREDYCGYIDCNTARAGYNESKRASESLCQAYRAQYGVECVIARIARCFGADKKEDSKAIAQFFNNVLNDEDIILKSKGEQKFSYCYVADAASGIFKILLDGKDGEAYNLADDFENKTLGDYAKLIAGFANKKVVYDIQDVAGASKANYAVVNCDKLKAIGWQPYYTVSSALERTYNILKK